MTRWRTVNNRRRAKARRETVWIWARPRREHGIIWTRVAESAEIHRQLDEALRIAHRASAPVVYFPTATGKIDGVITADGVIRF